MALELPELGPFLGRLASAPRSRNQGWLPVDDLRLGLATRLFKLGGSARIAGDAAPDVLTAELWSAAWNEAVVAVANRVIATVETRLRQAAEASRYPVKRLAQAMFSDADRRALIARLGEGGAPLLTALEEVDRLRRVIDQSPDLTDATRIDWLEALTAAARRQESAWRELERALDREGPLWAGEISTISSWTRPKWPLWVASGTLYALAIWVGLMLGGYVAAPGPLAPAVSWFWERF
jgi:hypothetical protein